MRATTLLLGTSLCLLLGLSAGCKKDKAPGAAPSASAKSQDNLGNADPTLLKRLVELSTICKITTETGVINCPKGENRTLMRRFTSGEQDRTKAIGTFAVALTHQDLKVRVAASNILYGAFRSAWTDAKPGSVNPKDADALIAAVFKLPKTQARQAIPAAVHAAALSGQYETLNAALTKTTEAEIKTLSTRYLMTHGRMQVFERISELSKSNNPAEVLAALESPRNMRDWSAEEQAVLCPWAAGFLGDARPSIASRAATLLGNCGGDFVDKLLDQGETAVKEGRFANTDLAGYRELCGPRRRTNGGANEAQCLRTRKLLEKVVETKTVDVQARNSALTTLAYQWPDDATLKLAKKLEKNPDRIVAEHAARTIRRLERRQAMPQPSALGRPSLGGLRRFHSEMSSPGAKSISAAPGAKAPAPAAPAAPAKDP